MEVASSLSERILFTDKALKQIYIHTQGFPRRITVLCHNSLIAMLRSNKKIVDEKLVLSLVYEEVDWYA